jgi:hypothetical protein
MAISKTASLEFSQNGQSATSYQGYAASLAAILAFAAAIQPYTDATIASCSYTEQQNDPTLPAAAGGNEQLEFMACFQLRKTALPQTVKVMLPAPNASIYTNVEGIGYKVKKTVGDVVATAFSALMGETYIFERGWLVS